MQKSNLFFDCLIFIVEFSSTNVHVEARSSLVLWEHSGHQAGRGDSTDSPPRWRAHQGGEIKIVWNH